MVLSCDSQLVDLVEHHPDLLVVHDHAVAVRVLAALTNILFGDVAPYVHGRRVVPEEERLICLGLLFHPLQGFCGDFLVDGLHALLGKRTGIYDRLLSDSSKASVRGGVVNISRFAMQDAARPEHRLKLRVFRIIGKFRLLLGVEVVQIAEEFIEPVNGRQKLVAIAQVVLAKLARGIALGLEQLGDGRVFRLQANGGAGRADLRQAGANRVLAGDKAGATCGAALLGVVVGEEGAFVGDAVDVGGPVSHHTVTELADVPDADIVAPKNEDIRFLGGHFSKPFSVALAC